MATSECINVVIRVRPMLPGEQEAGETPAVVMNPDGATVTVGTTSASFNKVFGPETTQDELYEYLKPSVEAVATGVNCTVFAYGQTGSGKTHTMLGRGLEQELLERNSFEPEPEWGLVPRAVSHLFQLLAEHATEGTTAVVHCAYMQIYNDKIFDLLQDRKRRSPLQIREMVKGRSRREVYVQNLAEFRVASAEDVMKLLAYGGRNRAVRGTEYNENSSRSHALLQLSVEVETDQEGGSTILRRAKLNMVDLAGSEKWDTNHVIGVERAKELTFINQSLSALGNCISALSDKKRAHVPYRDSKLTRLLQDSLGGNTRTTVVATLNPTATMQEESISTLMFADRAARVTTQVHRNEVVDDAVLLARAQKEIARLRALLENSELHSKILELEAMIDALRLENAQLQERLAQGGGSSMSGATPVQMGIHSATLTKNVSTTQSTSMLPPSHPTGSHARPPLHHSSSASVLPIVADAVRPDSVATTSKAKQRVRSGGPVPKPHSRAATPKDQLPDATPQSMTAPRSRQQRTRKPRLSHGDEENDDDIIAQLRAALADKGSAAQERVRKLAASADELCGKELAGLLHSVDSIAAERKMLEEQLATVQAGLVRGDTYLSETRRSTRTSSTTVTPTDESATFKLPTSGSVQPESSGSPDGSTRLTLHGDMRDAGAIVSVFSSRLESWDEGRIASYDPIRGMHLVVYLNGERKWHFLNDGKVRVLRAAPQVNAESATATLTADADQEESLPPKSQGGARKKKAAVKLDRTITGAGSVYLQRSQSPVMAKANPPRW